MSENNETKKITIPLQSDDSEFDNFFGLKFGMSITDAAFKCLCYGMDFKTSYTKKNNFCVFFKIDNAEFFNCKVQELELNFEFNKRKYYLVSSFIWLDFNKEKIEKNIPPALQEISNKFGLIIKSNKLFHKPTKRQLIYGGDEKNFIVAIGEKGMPEYIGTKVSFSSNYRSMIMIYSNEKLGIEFYKLENSLMQKNLSENEEENITSAFFIGISKSFSTEELLSFSAFWNTQKHKKNLPELAEKIRNVFKTFSSDSVDEKQICEEIRNVIEIRKNKILEEEDAEKQAKKAEKNKANEENMKMKKALYASLAAM